eukprot:2346205-Pleurochrysis_carterae.AAC.1
MHAHKKGDKEDDILGERTEERKRGMKVIPFAPETVGRSSAHYLTSMNGCIVKLNTVEAHLTMTDTAVQ